MRQSHMGKPHCDTATAEASSPDDGAGQLYPVAAARRAGACRLRGRGGRRVSARWLIDWGMGDICVLAAWP